MYSNNFNNKQEHTWCQVTFYSLRSRLPQANRPWASARVRWYLFRYDRSFLVTCWCSRSNRGVLFYFILQTSNKIYVKPHHWWGALLLFFCFYFHVIWCLCVCACCCFCVFGAQTWLVSCWTWWGVGYVSVGVLVGCCAHVDVVFEVECCCLLVTLSSCLHHPFFFLPLVSHVCIVWVCSLSPQLDHLLGF